MLCDVGHLEFAKMRAAGVAHVKNETYILCGVSYYFIFIYFSFNNPFNLITKNQEEKILMRTYDEHPQCTNRHKTTHHFFLMESRYKKITPSFLSGEHWKRKRVWICSVEIFFHQPALKFREIFCTKTFWVVPREE